MQNIKNYIPQYKKYLIDQAKSENTIKTYVGDVMQYNLEFSYINRDSILKYKKMLGELSSKTVNRKLSSLKSFNEFLLEVGVMDKIIIIKNDFVKLQQQLNPTNISNEEVKYFLKEVNRKNDMFNFRNKALINLIATTGIRREESTNILLKNLDFENGELIIVGKRNKQRTVLLNDKAIELIKEYLVDREKSIFRNSPYLFVSERSNKLHKDTVNRIFNLYKDKSSKITVHQLRHNWATSAVEQGLTLPEVQDQLGHSSVATSGVYAKARKSNIRKKINKLQIG